MHRLVVSLLVATLCLATVASPGQAWAQEPVQEQTEVQARPWNRDLTPYVVGFGAVVGVIAFNIAAPPAVAWGSSAARAIRNVGSVISAARTRMAGGAVRPAAVAAAAAVPARAAGVAAARPAAPLVPPLTQSMLAQAQIAAAAAAAAGAVVVSTAYGLVNWATGAAP